MTDTKMGKLPRERGVAHRRLGFVTLVCLLVGCHDTPTPDASTDAAAPDTPRFETIRSEMVNVLEESYRVELVRGTRADGSRTYLLYVHARSDPAPVVISNEPYAGIDWTGEEVDARWAALGNGTHPDVDAPAYDGNDVTNYVAQSVSAAAESDVVWLLNGAAVVHVYARFYAGGSLRDDAEDAAMAYAFIDGRSELAKDRVASYGSSWGGMMALTGAALARAPRPRTVVALSPPSDFVDLYRHTTVELPSVYPQPANVEAFFSPYWRRIAAALKLPPDATDPRAELFTTAGLCARLPTDVLIPHDDWDLLIPVRQTEALEARCGDRVQAIYWRRGPLDPTTLPLDHGYFGREKTVPSVRTFYELHVIAALFERAPSWLALGHQAALEEFLGLLRSAAADGADVAFALPPLREVADARSQLFDPTTSTFTPGAEVLAAAVNAVYGTTFDAPGLRAQLTTGLPDLPL